MEMEAFALARENSTVELQHRKVFREEIRNAIREAIFSRGLKPGDRIIETYWAEELGVSQGPVRQFGIWRPWDWWRRCHLKDPESVP